MSENRFNIVLSTRSVGDGAIRNVGDDLRGVERQARRTERQVSSSFGGMGRSAVMLSGAMAGVFVGMSAHKLVSITREFDKISAGLITATGSAEESEKAFEAIQDFATRTPYDLAQVTDSFIKLVNFGLDPSERALASYGNTSSALGKDLNQMVEAVADAVTGEFERLKEFGIKASSEGDKVAFTFRGITTTVGKNAAEIEQYLIKLGETNFGDAMLNRMNTLDGALSNLGDEWDKVYLNISRAGIGDVIADGVRVGIGALEGLNAQIASSQLEANLRANAGLWKGWGRDLDNTISFVGGLFGNLGVDGGKVVDLLTDAFREFPVNVRAFIGLMTVEVVSGFDKVLAYAKAFKTQLKTSFTDPTDRTTLAERIAKEQGIIDNARLSSIDAILAERQASLDSYAAQKEAAKKLREEYDKNREAPKGQLEDRLAPYKFNGGNNEPPPPDTNGNNILIGQYDKLDAAVNKYFKSLDKTRQKEAQRTAEIAERMQTTNLKIMGMNGVEASNSTAMDPWQKKFELREEYQKETLDKMADSENKFVEDAKSATMGWAAVFSASLNDMLYQSEKTFGGMALSFGKMGSQMLIQQGVTKALEWGFSLIPSAQGNVFTGPGISSYSNKIVDSPTIFPFAKGVGLMGEAGSEAIMPLTRMPSGNLGVETTTGSNKEINITNNITVTSGAGGTEQDREGLSNKIAKAIRHEVIGIISEQKRYGGALYNG